MAARVLPQRATPSKAEVLSVEWLFEPEWPGQRIMARTSDGRADLADEAGQPVVADEAVAILVAGVTAEAALVECTLTAEPLGSEERQVVVATDLVELDRQSVADVPFQERRRLLESLIVESDGLRLSPVVKHPISGWLPGWRDGGITHYLARHQNSRYLPGQENPEVLKVPIRIEGPTGLVGGLIGRRGRPRRIAD